MEIDIISYSSEQFALLSAEQLQEVKEAQMKKNRLKRTLEEKIKKEKAKRLDNGTFLSDSWVLQERALRTQYEEEISWIRDALIFYLQYSTKPEPTINAPYPVDFSISYEERLKVVKEYYLEAFSSGKERYDAFVKDDMARAYLGELYLPLRDYFHEFV